MDRAATLMDRATTLMDRVTTLMDRVTTLMDRATIGHYRRTIRQYRAMIGHYRRTIRQHRGRSARIAAPSIRVFRRSMPLFWRFALRALPGNAEVASSSLLDSRSGRQWRRPGALSDSSRPIVILSREDGEGPHKRSHESRFPPPFLMPGSLASLGMTRTTLGMTRTTLEVTKTAREKTRTTCEVTKAARQNENYARSNKKPRARRPKATREMTKTNR
ncbi:MAG TPA: hypothetical protein VGG02_05545 [Chthoniobacterales bacterium]|jgi:hypothetical protein